MVDLVEWTKQILWGPSGDPVQSSVDYFEGAGQYDPTANALYALGGWINDVTGGTTTDWTIPQAVAGNENQPSSFVETVSAYDADANGWQLPVFNPHAPELVDDLLDPFRELGKWLLFAAGAVGLVWWGSKRK